MNHNIADSQPKIQHQELICIGCPMGCQLSVEWCAGPAATRRIIRISGQQCARGTTYAQDEILQPRRMVTSLIAIPGRDMPLSVRTRTPIPKKLIFDCLRVIRQTVVQPPVHQGDCIIANILDTGVDVIATRDLL